MSKEIEEFESEKQRMGYVSHCEDAPAPPGVGKMEPGEHAEDQSRAARFMMADRRKRMDFSDELVTPDGKRDALMRQFIISENNRVLEIFRANNLDVGARLLFTAFGLALPLIFIGYMLSTLPR